MTLLLFAPFFILVIGILIWLVLTSGTTNTFKTDLDAIIREHNFQKGTAPPQLPIFQKLGYVSQPTMLSGVYKEHRISLYEAIPPATTQHFQRAKLQTVTLLSIEYPQILPDLVVIPARGVMALAFDATITSTFGFERLSLEGNFDDYVRVYAEPGTQIDVLSYLTPEVMVLIQDKIKSFIVLSENVLSVSAYMPLTVQSLQIMLDDIIELQAEIRHKPATLA